jgi:hypothetical protein
MTEIITRRTATAFEASFRPAFTPETDVWASSTRSIGVFPDIQAKFCLEKYRRRELLLAAKYGRQYSIPNGLPARLTSFSWNSETLDLSDITYRTTSDDILELEAALKDFNGASASLNQGLIH